MKPKKSTEKEYARALKKIARHAAHIVEMYADGAVITYPARMMAELEKYAVMIEPWANSTAAKMIASTKSSVERTIKSQSRQIALTLRQQINSTPMGVATRAIQNAQVELITSLPLDAGVRAQNLALQAFTGGRRPDEIAKEIARTQEVTESRAMLIARTETAKAASIVTEVRAKEVGATHYIWRTADDSDVRESHAEMEGQVVAYDDPPTLDGMTGNAGEFPNCFIGSTPFVSLSNIKRIIRANYTGKVVTISCNGVDFTATLNHPILTNRGWIAAESINVGDYLIKAIPLNNVEVMYKKDGNYSTFDEVFSALAFRSECHSGLEFNFYGDIPDGDVDIISSDFILSNNIVADRFKAAGNLPLSGSDCGIDNVGVISGINKIGESLCSSACNTGTQSFGRHCGHTDDVSLATSPSGNSVSGQNLCDSSPIDSIFSGTCKLANSRNIIPNDVRIGEICKSIVRDSGLSFDGDADGFQFSTENIRTAADCDGCILEHNPIVYEFCRVTDKIVTDYFGHVYTLETDSGWYGVTDAGIVSKNCRCYSEPIIPE